MLFRTYITASFFLLTVAALGQFLPQPYEKESIYEFLQEIADEQKLEINTAIKPYGRKAIAEQLELLMGDEDSLNERQRKELDFYRKDYIKERLRENFEQSDGLLFSKSEKKRLDGVFANDTIAQLSVNPILGTFYNASENIYSRRVGLEVNSYLGKRWAAWFSYRDVVENEQQIRPSYLTQNQAGVVKSNNQGGVDYSEMRGGLSYAWDWGYVALMQEPFQWGNHQHGALIFSGRSPAVPQLRLQVKPFKWLEFNALHGWLSSEVIDSAASYQLEDELSRVVFQPKYISANFFSIKPFPRFYFSVGNSTVYSDMPVQPAYLIPFFFHRPVDHALSAQRNLAGSNSQLFFDISSRNIRQVHLYASLFIDEIRLSTAFDAAEQRNQLSFKVGVRYSNILNTNISVVGEYFRANPYAYRHFIPSATFATNRYNMGYYLGDNAEELHIALLYKPLPRLLLRLSYTDIGKGPEIPFSGTGLAGQTGAAFMTSKEFTKTLLSLQARYEILHDIYLNASITQSSVTDNTGRYVPAFERGDNTFINLGLHWGF